MTYDGLGNRLEVTTYSDGESNTTRYVLDGGTVLAALGAENTTYYIYGLGAIGTLGESWSYMLQDGAGSTRQLVDEEGAVNLSVSYTPWGDTMEIYGSGMLNLGYLGGVYDAGTGLIYMGNGQYYDPSTGRFLTRGAQQGQSNPYTPWNSDPAGMLIAPLALLALVFGRKKTRTKFDQFIILLVLAVTLSLTISLPVNAQSISSTTSTSSNTMPLGYVTVTIGGTYRKDIPSNSASAVEVYRFAVICNEEEPTTASRVIVFGGSDVSIPGELRPYAVEDSVPGWLVDGDGNPIPNEQLISFDGNKTDMFNYVRDKHLLPDENVILIAYSAGNEPALMYARWRWENGQKVDSTVLLGPTFESPNENGYVIEFGKTGGKAYGDWASYLDAILNYGTNVLVVDDGWRFWKQNEARDYYPQSSAIGKFNYWLEIIDHEDAGGRFCTGTPCSSQLRKRVYDWIETPWNRHSNPYDVMPVPWKLNH